MPSKSRMPIANLAEALQSAYPELADIRGASEAPVYVVGGAVRDLLLHRGRADLDVVVEGDAAVLAARLGAPALAEYQRFGTAKVKLDGHELDIVSARAEIYPYPGALPSVAAATDIAADLARRDFTINAMAIPLRGEARVIDPHGGRADLERELLRVLHPGSFVDDPTRAIRAARYAARLGFGPDPGTAELLRATDLGTVSVDRRRTELLRLAVEATAAPGLALLAEWGLIELRDGGLELAGGVIELLGKAPWAGEAPRGQAVLAAALGPVGGASNLALAKPRRPSQAVELAGVCDPIELVLARAMGADWLDQYLLEWRSVALEIDGGDLIAAGVSQGPALGRGLRSALRLKIDGEIRGREQELAAALQAAEGG